MIHINALKSSNVSISIVMNLPYLIVINNKKQVVGFEGKLRPFWTHDVSKSNVVIPVETTRPHLPSF